MQTAFAAKMPKKGGKRAAHSRDAGAKGGRPKKAAAADVVLQQPAAELPVKGAAVLGRPPKKQDAAPRVRRADDQITCAEASAGLGMPLVERPRNGTQRGRRESSCQGQGRSSRAKGSRGIPSHFCLLLSFVCCSQKSIAQAQRNKSLCFSTQYCLKRNTRAAATTAGEQGEAATTAPAKEGGKRENKAAGAHAAACVLVLTAEAGISFGCSEHQEQMQQQQSRSPMA